MAAFFPAKLITYCCCTGTTVAGGTYCLFPFGFSNSSVQAQSVSAPIVLASQEEGSTLVKAQERGPEIPSVVLSEKASDEEPGPKATPLLKAESDPVTAMPPLASASAPSPKLEGKAPETSSNSEWPSAEIAPPSPEGVAEKPSTEDSSSRSTSEVSPPASQPETSVTTVPVSLKSPQALSVQPTSQPAQLEPAMSAQEATTTSVGSSHSEDSTLPKVKPEPKVRSSGSAGDSNLDSGTSTDQKEEASEEEEEEGDDEEESRSDSGGQGTDQLSKGQGSSTARSRSRRGIKVRRGRAKCRDQNSRQCIALKQRLQQSNGQIPFSRARRA
nr:hypothetical protein [Candidatus Mycoplasma haematolamae]